MLGWSTSHENVIVRVQWLIPSLQLTNPDIAGASLSDPKAFAIAFRLALARSS